MPDIVRSEKIPVLNPFRLIKANDTLPENINTWGPDSGFFSQHFRQWEYGNTYTIKRNYSDIFDIYIDTLATEVYIRLLDDQGNELTTAYSLVGLTGTTVPGNVYSYLGTDYPYQSIYASFKFSDIYGMVPFQQVFYIALECVYLVPGDSASTWYVSEPIFVRQGDWKKTMLIEATHSISKYDVMFEAIPGIKFHYRIEAAMSDDPQPAFHETAFEDQRFQNTILDSNPYRLFDFIAGIGGVPKYMLDIINRAISCDYFTIDGIRYVKDVGANWSMVNAEGSRYHSAKIRLQEYEHDGGTVYSDSLGEDGSYTDSYGDSYT